MSEAPQNNKPRSIFTSTKISSYERSFTAMSFTLVNDNCLISLAPIFDEHIGKEPKKGDSVYDYDSKMNFSIDSQAAIGLRRGIESLMENEELTQFIMTFGNEKTRRTLTLFKPNAVKLAGKNYDNYILKLTQTKDDGEEKMYHIMQRTTNEFKNTSKEVMADELEIDLLLLIEFCARVLDNAFCVAYHGSKRNSSFTPSGGSPKRAHRAVQEDGEGDEGGGEKGGEEEEGQTSTAKKPAAGKAGRRTSISDEFKE